MKRIDKLHDWMKQHHIETLLIENPIDLQYLTGLYLSLGKLLITKDQAALFVDGRYKGAAMKKVPSMVHDLTEAKKALHSCSSITFDSSWTTVDQLSTYQKEFPHTTWSPYFAPLRLLRAIKEPQEVELLRKAARLTWDGIQHVRSLLKTGVTERELALAFEVFCKQKGASGLSFEPIIAFGVNSAYPHYRAGNARLKEGDIVLIDVGAMVDGYTGDLTRTYFFGKPNPKLEEMEKYVKKASLAAILKIAPKVKAGHLDQIAHTLFEKHNVKPLYMHSLGHGLGLEVHEFPRLSINGVDKEVPLQAGFCITIEPGLYLEGVGGIRFEQMIHVTEKGAEILSDFEGTFIRPLA